MYAKASLIFFLSTTAATLELFPRQDDNCSSWSSIASDLQSEFSGCNDDARAAIRAPFHDCVNNGCDGSLILAGECSRSENAGLQDICNKLGAKATQYNVGTADMIQFAAAVAIAICPLGPRVQALVGRQDSSVAAPEGEIPETSDSVDEILSTFAAKGFSAQDVVALVGSHTAARQFFDDPTKAGASIDSTPSTWDITFYAQTLAGTAPYSFSSDKRMSTDTRVSCLFFFSTLCNC